MNDLVWADATAQAEVIRRKDVSATQLLDAYLERLERFNPTLRAFVALDETGARLDARAVDDATAKGDVGHLGPFSGVTISIKDVIDVAGLPTTHSSKVLADDVAAADAPLVMRLREAGFVVLGKTNVPEFCSSVTSSELHGTCRNPWDLDRTPAGSSGGAAAAVAGGLCAIAHGTDGAGSVRVPAAYCGLVGLKPTRGRVSFGPEVGDAYYGTTVDGILCRSVRDAAATLDVFSQPVESFASGAAAEPGALRVGVAVEPPFGRVDVECADAATGVGRLLAEQGHHVGDVSPAWGTVLEAVLGPMSVPGPAGLVPLDRVSDVEPRNRPLIERGHELTVVDHARWVELLRARSAEFLALWDDIDVLVTPTAPILPPPVDFVSWDLPFDEHSARFVEFPLPSFAQPFNLTGQPALTLPLAWSADGMPIGVQLVARRGDEVTLFRVARQLEEARPWQDRRPPAVS
jgi:amidase